MDNTPRHIQLMDTTLRDGEQTQGVSFSPEEKVNLARALLQQLKVDRIEVASARVSHGEMEAVSNINQWAQQQGLGERIEVLGFVDHKKSVDWILQTGGQVINLLTKGSEKHCREQLGKTLDQHVAEILQTVDYALAKGPAGQCLPGRLVQRLSQQPRLCVRDDESAQGLRHPAFHAARYAGRDVP